MKLSRLFMIALLVGTMGVIGCGDDSSSGNGNGNGNGASGVCSECDSQQRIPECEQTYNVCVQDDGGTPEDCAVAALLRCQLV
jgi:hypothetical protein